MRLHNPGAGVAVRVKQQVTDFMGHTATQNCAGLKGAVASARETDRVFVVDTGESRMNCETEDVAFQIIPGRRSKYPHPNIGSGGRFLTGFWGASGGWSSRAFYPNYPHSR